MEINRIYVKNRDNNEKHKITFHNTKYVSIELVSLSSIFKNFFKNLWYYCNKNETNNKQYLDSLIEVSKLVFNKENEERIKDNYSIIRYEEFFQEEFNIGNQIPKYIM